MQDIKQWCLSS